MLTLYGIPNCDSCRNARKWLDNNGITHTFHDIRKDGLTKQQLRRWIDAVSSKRLVNTRSTTWRELDDEMRSKAGTDDVVPLLLAHPTLIKRPVVEGGQRILVGFSDADYVTTLLAQDA